MLDREHPTVRAATVTLAVGDDASAPAPALLAILAGEAIEVSAARLSVVLATSPADCEVLVVWSPAGLDAVTADRVVAWARGRAPSSGLLLWSEHADRMVAERALAAGFDDVQRGPCSARELAVRIRALHRRVHREATRSRARPTARVRYRDLLLDPETCELWLDRRAVALTVTEFTTLVALLRAHGAVLSRAELLDRAWGGDHLDVGERAVDNVILRLRRKLGRPDLIQTVRGVGFRIGEGGEPAAAPADDDAEPAVDVAANGG